MTFKRIPLLPTLLVLVAVGVMVRLGFWQLDRLHQKEALLAKYGQAERMNSDLPANRLGEPQEDILYRHVRFECGAPTQRTAIAGLNDKGQSGVAQIAVCPAATDQRTIPVTVSLGWSSNPAPAVWQGGTVAGIVAPMGKTAVRVVADPPLAGLQANARPDPANLPNNHLSYAIQWFLFAATALVIYGLALRKRLAA